MKALILGQTPGWTSDMARLSVTAKFIPSGVFGCSYEEIKPLLRSVQPDLIITSDWFLNVDVVEECRPFITGGPYVLLVSDVPEEDLSPQVKAFADTNICRANEDGRVIQCEYELPIHNALEEVFNKLENLQSV